MQAHMDWHFRRNRKERESGGRGSHRRWLPRAEVSVAGKIGADWQEWINETASAEAGPSHSPTKAQSGDQGPAKLTAERTATLQRRWVRVPSDSSKAATPCPICKEAFRSEWSEEEEEWVWRNAVDINGTVSLLFWSEKLMEADRRADLPCDVSSRADVECCSCEIARY